MIEFPICLQEKVQFSSNAPIEVFVIKDGGKRNQKKKAFGTNSEKF